MATPRLTAIPDRINAGTSLELTLGWSDYPANGGWSLVLFFNGPAANSVQISGGEIITNGTFFDVTISSTKTGTMGTGATAGGLGLKWIARLTSGSLIKDAEEGRIILDPDPTTAGVYQSQAEKELANVNAAITARLTGGIESYQVQGRAASYYSLRDLYAIKSSLEARVASEQSGGTSLGPVILPAFVQTS